MISDPLTGSLVLRQILFVNKLFYESEQARILSVTEIGGFPSVGGYDVQQFTSGLGSLSDKIKLAFPKATSQVFEIVSTGGGSVYVILDILELFSKDLPGEFNQTVTDIPRPFILEVVLRKVNHPLRKLLVGAQFINQIVNDLFQYSVLIDLKAIVAHESRLPGE